MKTESCRINQLLASSIKSILIFTLLNVFLMLQGYYGDVYLQLLKPFEGNTLILIKVVILIVLILFFALSYLVIKKNTEIRRRFIHLSLAGFLFLTIFTFMIECLIAIFIVYHMNPQMDMFNQVNGFIQELLPLSFIFIQLDILLFPIFIESCRRKYYL